MSKPKLYYMPESTGCRTIMLVARMLNIDIDYQRRNLSTQEHLKDAEFMAANPFHVIPTLVDTDGFVLWESRVIARYLIETRSPDSALYPAKDIKRRTTIEKFLHYDLGTFYRAIGEVAYPIFFTGKPGLDKLPRLVTVLETLDQWLGVANKENGGATAFIAGGNELSLADISLFFSFSFADVVPEIEIEIGKNANIVAWRALVEKAVAKWNDDDWMNKARADFKAYVENVKVAHQNK